MAKHNFNCAGNEIAASIGFCLEPVVLPAIAVYKLGHYLYDNIRRKLDFDYDIRQAEQEDREYNSKRNNFLLDSFLVSPLSVLSISNFLQDEHPKLEDALRKAVQKCGLNPVGQKYRQRLQKLNEDSVKESNIFVFFQEKEQNG